MADDNVDQLAANARIELRQRLVATPPDIRRLAQRARARRRALSGVAAAFVIAAIAVPLALRNHDGASQITAGPAPGTTVGYLVDLRGRVVSVALPASLADDFQIVEQDASLAVDGTSWRVDVTRTDEPSGVVVTDGCVPAPSAVIGMVGAWTVTFTGDGMTPGNCELLRQQIGSFEQQPNGVLMYGGSGTLGPIDGPDVLAATARSRVYLFHRNCSEPTKTRTRSGLTVARVDDPARGATLTVLCSLGSDVEIWLESPRWPSNEEIDAIAVR